MGETIVVCAGSRHTAAYYDDIVLSSGLLQLVQKTDKRDPVPAIPVTIEPEMDEL